MRDTLDKLTPGVYCPADCSCRGVTVGEAIRLVNAPYPVASKRGDELADELKLDGQTWL